MGKSVSFSYKASVNLTSHYWEMGLKKCCTGEAETKKDYLGNVADKQQIDEVNLQAVAFVSVMLLSL